MRHSPPSPASTGCTLFRTSAPPSRTECDGNVRASSLLDAQRRDVVRPRLLALDPVVGDHGIVAGDQFRHRVAEMHQLSLPSETYSSTIVTWLSSSTRIRLRGWLITGNAIAASKQTAARSALRRSRRAERARRRHLPQRPCSARKAVPALVKVTPQMLLHQAAGSAAQCLGQSRNLYAVGQWLARAIVPAQSVR